MPTSPASGAYSIDPTHSRIGFVARHAMVTKVRGSFTKFNGSGLFDAETPSNSSLSVEIDATSIDTGNADRDGHLRSNDFFDMEHFPTITFTSTAVNALRGDIYRVVGDLTIKNVTQSVEIDFEVSGPSTDPYGNQRLGLEGSTTINRKDFGVSWNAALETGGVLVGEKIVLEFDVSVIRSN
jgi:polyisoprenoid-binding protein YceI